MWIDEGCSRPCHVTWKRAAWASIIFVLSLLLVGCGGGDASVDRDSVESAPGASETAATANDATEPVTVADLFPQAPGRSLVLNTCGACHSVACSAIGQRRPARWNNIKENHRDKVQSLSEDDLQTAFAYLAEHFNDSKPEPKVPPHLMEGGCTPF